MKSANRVRKKYLQAYINHTQNNWVDNLPIAEFAANNHVNASTEIMLFFADYNFHPQTSMKPPGTYKGKQKVELLAADKIVGKQAKIMTFLQDQLAWMQDEQT